MKCANCGTERSIGKFCPECGSQEIAIEKKVEESTEIKCGNCGRIRARGKFCPDCGSQEIYVEPQVMVCSDCGTVRKSGKFCSECGSTNITYKPASLYENSDIQEPIFVPKADGPKPIEPKNAVPEPIAVPVESNADDDIVITDDYSAASDVFVPMDIPKEPQEKAFDKSDSMNSLKKEIDNSIDTVSNDTAISNIGSEDGDSADIASVDIDTVDDGRTYIDSAQVDPVNDGTIEFMSLESNLISNAEKKIINNGNLTPLSGETTEILTDDTEFDNFADDKDDHRSKADTHIESKQVEKTTSISSNQRVKKEPVQTQAKTQSVRQTQTSHQDHKSQTDKSYPKDQTVQSSQVAQESQAVQQFQSYQQAQTSAYSSQSYTQTPYMQSNMQSNMQYNNLSYDYSNDPYMIYTTRQPRQKRTIPLTPTSEALKKCRIAIFILTAIEFFAMFLPAATYGNGFYSESVSLADGHGFIIFVGLIILTILGILAGFSNYVGCAIGLLIQSLILSIASFFIVALVNEDRSASKGIAYYIFLIVPIIIIIISIAVVRLSIRLKVEIAESNRS